MATPQFCSTFSDRGTSYFAAVTLNGAQDGAEGSADLAVTDGTAAWTAQGLTSDTLSGAPGARLKHLLAALTELEAPAVAYSRSLKHAGDGSTTLAVEWPGKGGLSLVVRAPLARAEPAQPVIASMLSLLLDNLTALKQLAEQQQRQLGEFEKQAERSQDLIDRYVNTKEQQDRETNAKVAALLNSKKAKLRELRDQLQEAQEEIERLKAGGAVPMEADEEEEEEEEEEEGGAPGAQRQQQQGSGRAGGRRQGGGRAARVVEDSEEEEEEDEEGASGYESPNRGESEY